MNFLTIKVIFSKNKLENLQFFYSIIVLQKMKIKVLVKTHKQNLAGQHSELLYWTSNGQFKSKMDLPLEKISKITCGALTNFNNQSNYNVL